MEALLQVVEFLGSIPLFQQCASVWDIAQRLQPLQLDPFQKLSSNARDLYIVWDGELVIRIKHELTILKAGDYGFADELRGAIASKKTTCFVLRAEDSALVTAKSIWPSSSNSYLLEQTMQIEKLGIDSFRGFTDRSLLSFRQMYGGQLVAQALAAASKSVSPFLLVRSLHSHFLLPGDMTIPVTYKVQRLLDRRNLANRFITALQDGKIIFSMSASFEREASGPEHQTPMPAVVPPQELPSEEQIYEQYVKDPRISSSTRNLIKADLKKQRPLDVRYCDPVDFVDPEAREARQRVWFRAKGRLLDDQALHRCVAAYASDWCFLDCSFRPHGITTGSQTIFSNVSVKALSLDHALWFHKPVKADDWLLFVMESPRASDGRALVMGHIYNKQGEMVISASQEGLMRNKAKL